MSDEAASVAPSGLEGRAGRLVDEVVARLAPLRRTFTEQEAFASLWEEGYEIMPQMDPRFLVAQNADGTHPTHWRLDSQTLANNRLLDLLNAGEWDGRRLDAFLERLDGDDGVHYVFCPVDPRFSRRVDGALEPADREREVVLPEATASALAELAPVLLMRWREAGQEPWTVRQVTEALNALGWPGAHERGVLLLVRAWLRAWPQVVRVGADYWVPNGAVPDAPTQTRLAVLPVPRPSAEPSAPFPEGNDVRSPSIDEALSQGQPRQRDDTLVLPGSTQPGPLGTSWTAVLRTVHVLESFVPIPASCRGAYPPRPAGAATGEVLRGKWFDTGDDLWLWLDRTHDRLYGPDLASHLEWCEAGQRLRVEWAPDALVLHTDGIHSDVQREETRLVNLQELATLRGGLGESYRRSLVAILPEAPAGLSFREVVAALSSRQGHAVHRGTVRALLSAGAFVHRDGRWFAPPDPEGGARRLRSAMVQTLVAPRDHDEAEGPVHRSGELGTIVRAVRTRLQELMATFKHERPR